MELSETEKIQKAWKQERQKNIEILALKKLNDPLLYEKMEANHKQNSTLTTAELLSKVTI
jgi:hypothetical protein